MMLFVLSMETTLTPFGVNLNIQSTKISFKLSVMVLKGIDWT